MDFLSQVKSLREEALAGIQYKNMRAPFNVFSFIIMLPYIVAAFAQFVAFYILVFFYNGVAAASDFLETWVEKKKKNIHPATEAVLYLVTMPFIFVCQCFLSLFSIFFYFSWFILQINCYIATLGGTRWQPFLYHAKFGDEAPKFYASTKPGAYIAFVVVNLCFIGFDFFLSFINLVIRDYRATSVISVMIAVFAALNALFILIAVVSMFKKKFVEEGKTAEYADTAVPVKENADAPAAAPVVPVAETAEDDFLPEL